MEFNIPQLQIPNQARQIVIFDLGNPKMDADQRPDLICPIQEAVRSLCAAGRDAAALLPPAAVEALRSAVGDLCAARAELTQEQAQALWATCCELWVRRLVGQMCQVHAVLLIVLWCVAAACMPYLSACRPSIAHRPSRPHPLQNLCVEVANAPEPPAPSTGDPCTTTSADTDTSNSQRQRAVAALLRQSVCEALAHVADQQLAEEEHVTRLGFALKVSRRRRS